MAHPHCDIVAVAKRRDGGTRYWCTKHRADATAMYGRRARYCRAAALKPVGGKPFVLDLEVYQGPVALWGAVPAVYDTTRLPLDRGIHVHARKSVDAKKEIDATYSRVRVLHSELGPKGVEVAAIDAIYYMVSSVFGFAMKRVECTYCGELHLDRDWFSVHPHQRHLCAACGRTFRDSRRSVGNPILALRQALGARPHPTRQSGKPLSIRQQDFPGGLQIWGSNPALLWTGEKPEEEGIHVHAFKGATPEPDLDDTYSEVSIDGVGLDAEMVQLLMAQNTLPHLKGRIQTLHCDRCRTGVFDRGEWGFTPSWPHTCESCGGTVGSRGRFRKTIGNPLPGVLEDLARFAPRPPQSATLDLLPEAPGQAALSR